MSLHFYFSFEHVLVEVLIVFIFRIPDTYSNNSISLAIPRLSNDQYSVESTAVYLCEVFHSKPVITVKMNTANT